MAISVLLKNKLFPIVLVAHLGAIVPMSRVCAEIIFLPNAQAGTQPFSGITLDFLPETDLLNIMPSVSDSPSLSRSLQRAHTWSTDANRHQPANTVMIDSGWTIEPRTKVQRSISRARAYQSKD